VAEKIRTEYEKKRGKRPPIFAILTLILFSLAVLILITYRQLGNAEADRLRLLAGFSARVENALHGLANIFLQSSNGDDFETRLEEITNLELLAKPIIAEGAERTVYMIEVGGPEILITKNQPIGNDEAGAGSEEPYSGTRSATARIDLEELARPIFIQSSFDSLFISNEKGRVLYQQGEPLLQMNHLERVLREHRVSVLPIDWGSDGGEKNGDSRNRSAEPPTHSSMFEIEVAGSEYKLFLQPIVLRLPQPENEPSAEPVYWLACGLVSSDNLLSDSFATSPILSFLLIAILPAALIFWPFLKLRLISFRQRFTRFDFTFLVLSTLVGILLATFMVLDLGFTAHLYRIAKEQLRDSANEIKENLRNEISLAAGQLQRMNEDHAAIRYLEENPIQKKEGGLDLDGLVGLRPEILIDYPIFHSVFWVDEGGDQAVKLPMLPYATLTNNVSDRNYFKAIRDERGYMLDLPRQGSREPPSRIYLDSIRSMTSNIDLAVMSIEGPGRLEGTDLDLRAAVMVTRLMSLSYPVLPDGFSYTIIDENGRVLFHIDPKRNLTENFFKASDENSVLEAITRKRHEGFVSLDYWGQESIAYAMPLEGLPWTLVTFKGTDALRARNVELLSDFLNPLFLYLLVMASIALVMIRVFPAQMRLMWPSWEYTRLYSYLVLATPVLFVIMAIAYHQSHAWTFILSFFGPFTVMIALYLCHLFLRWLNDGGLSKMSKSQDGKKHLPLQGDGKKEKKKRRALVDLDQNLRVLLTLVALLVYGIVLWLSSSTMIALMVGPVLFVGWVWLFWLEPYFRGRQRAFAFTFMLSCLLLITGVLPALGFFGLAASRQRQFLVQNTQADLALATEHRKIELETARKQYPASFSSSMDRFEEHLDQMRDRYLGVFFQTRMSADEARPRGKDIWPMGGAGHRLGDFMARLFSHRVIPVNGSNLEPVGLDLSRFDRIGPSWVSGESIQHDAGQRVLQGSYKEAYGTGPLRSYISFYPELDQLRNHDSFWIKAALSFLLIAVLLLPVILALFIAHRVFLVTIVAMSDGIKVRDVFFPMGYEPESKEKKQNLVLDDGLWLAKLARIFRANLSAEPTTEEALDHRMEKVLLVTSVPDLAIQHMREEEGVEPFEVLDLSEFATMETQADPARKEPEAEPEPEDAEGDQAVTTTEVGDPEVPRGSEGDEGASSASIGREKTLVLKNLNHAMVEMDDWDEVNQLLHKLERAKRTIIIMTQSEPVAVFREIISESREERLQKLALRRLWSSYLSGFVFRFGLVNESKRDFKVELGEYKRMWNRMGKRYGEKLSQWIYHECKWTAPLQNIGLHFASEVTNPVYYSKRQVIAKVALMARNYYQAIWDSFDANDKLVLVQLAEEGLVNPKAIDRVNDLIHRGLVTRTPALGLMNESFARFINRAVKREQVIAWEKEGVTSAWTIFKWILPIPLVLLAGFLFITQRNVFSSLIGFMVAVGSLAPIFLNLFSQFSPTESTPNDEAETA